MTRERERLRFRIRKRKNKYGARAVVVGSVLAAAAAAAAAMSPQKPSGPSSSPEADKLARLYSALRHHHATTTTGTTISHQQHQASEELRPVCRYCGRSYSSPSNLRQHVKNVHSNWPPQETWPQCGVCGKRCKTKHYLINHQLQAHGIHQRPSGHHQQHHHHHHHHHHQPH